MPTNGPAPWLVVNAIEAVPGGTAEEWKMSRTVLIRNATAIGVGVALSYGFWMTRPTWVDEMRLWKAAGDASLILLYLTLIPGPLARLAPRTSKLIPWRREFGVAFGVFALLHTVLILDGWARWDVQRFLGYEFIPELGRIARLEPGFGLANLIGITALLFSLALLGTSTDWALRTLGASAWKFLHYSVYVIFWLLFLHTVYFLFIHYTQSFHRAPPPPDWFRYPFLGLTFGVAAIQLVAFFSTVRGRKLRAAPARGAVPLSGIDVGTS